jgi:hypothetical protein
MTESLERDPRRWYEMNELEPPDWLEQRAA